MTTPRIDLSAGTIEYEDSSGPGPAVVLLHGLLMDASLRILPRARVVEVSDSYTLIPLDQPAWLAAALRAFLREGAYAAAR